MYGAIDNTGKFLFLLHKGTNQVGWKMFLRDVKEHVDSQYVSSPPTLVIDNHSVHKAKGVMPYYEGFNVLFTPPYSSDLNAIETVWAIMKAKLSKELDRLPRELDQLDFEAEIDLVLHQISEETDMKRLMFAARNDLLKALS